jgi:hypothetical protein
MLGRQDFHVERLMYFAPCFHSSASSEHDACDAWSFARRKRLTPESGRKNLRELGVALFRYSPKLKCGEAHRGQALHFADARGAQRERASEAQRRLSVSKKPKRTVSWFRHI